MKLHWISAAILSAAVAVGCGDRGQENAQNVDQTAAAPADQPAGVDRQAVSPDADNSAIRPDTSGSRSTAGNRTSSSGTARTTPRPEPAPSGDRSFDRNNATTTRNNAPLAPAYREVTVPAGTALPLELMTALSSESTTVETPVRARLKQSISVDGYNILPAGTVFSGTVTEVQKAGRVKGRARVAFLLTDAMVGGAKETVKTNPIIFEGEASRGEDAAKIGAGAGIGAVIGGILGGGSGAAKGAAIGGAAGTGAVLATRGQQVNIAEGADIAAVLTDSLTIQVTSK